MKKRAIPSLLLLNAVLATLFVVQLNIEGKPKLSPAEETHSGDSPVTHEVSQPPSATNKVHPWAHAATTPFEKIYSDNPAAFAANLRRIGCPEETVRDLVQAQVNKKYRGLEEQLRPLPADHVPWGWSSKTSEGKLIDRRQQASATAREKEQILRGALGYDVAVNMPVYAMTSSDNAFRKALDAMPPEQRVKAQAVNEAYWSSVQNLRNRTSGFWEPEDLQELEAAKLTRNLELQKITGNSVPPAQ